MSTIEIRKVTKQFGSFTAVKDADLKVEAGEVVCLLGPSGCGKTTTLRMIAGLERATSGDVIIAGQRMNELPPQKRDIAMVFQFYALYPALTVGQNIAMPLHSEGLSKADSDARVMKVATIMHLTEVLDRMPNQISEGEKQRLAVARAIVRDPNCFLFDEPLSRLDVELRHSMRGQIKEVLTGASATIVVRVVGPDLGELQRKAAEVGAAIGGVNGAADVKVQALTLVPQIEVAFDPVRAQQLGVTPAAVRETRRIGAGA